jgi:phage tail-like protein
MAEFPTNPKRFDPYKNFNFRVKWDGQYIPAITRVSGLLRTTGVIENRESGDLTTSRKSAALTQFAPIVLERGLTDDPAFEDWANLVFQLAGAPETSLNEFRKNIYIELYNEAGKLVRSYLVYRCWPSEYRPFSQLDANVAAELIESLTLQNEGWERDTSVVPPPQT